MTLLQRIHKLVGDPGIHQDIAAKILRKICSSSDEADKAHAITGHLRKLSAEDQEKILKAVESLR